uniref:Uncharacterized protein n=1 Tax=Micrurus paraensis TaxID=1970185 RepID=A0A2D4KKS0_9SAUR
MAAALLLQQPEVRGGVSGRRRLCVAEPGLRPRRDKFGGVSLHLAQLRSPESLDQAAFGRWLQGKCLLLEACGETEDRAQSDQRCCIGYPHWESISCSRQK